MESSEATEIDLKATRKTPEATRKTPETTETPRGQFVMLNAVNSVWMSRNEFVSSINPEVIEQTLKIPLKIASCNIVNRSRSKT